MLAENYFLTGKILLSAFFAEKEIWRRKNDDKTRVIWLLGELVGSYMHAAFAACNAAFQKRQTNDSFCRPQILAHGGKHALQSKLCRLRHI